MARAILTMKVMPATADVDLSELETRITALIKKMGCDTGKIEREPVAFGLMSLKVMFIADENRGTDEFEQAVAGLEGVQSVQITDFRRALG